MHQLLGNGKTSKEMKIEKTIEEILEAVFSMRPVPRLYNEDKRWSLNLGGGQAYDHSSD